MVVDQLPRLGKRELVCLLLLCGFCLERFPFLWVLGMGNVILLWHSLSLPYNYFTVFSTGSFCQVYRVTDEALIAETAICPNFFLMNIFFALKGSKLFIIICFI